MNATFGIPALPLRALFAVCLAAGPLAADEVEKLGESFEQRRAAVTTQRDEQLVKLETGYQAALNRHLEKVKASGKLEDVLILRDEIEAVKDGTDPLPPLPATAGNEFKQLRKTYDESRARILKTHETSVADLAAKATEALKAKEVQLTKAGKIEQALEAKKLREAIEKEEGIADAKPGGKPDQEAGADGWISIKKAEVKVISESQLPVKWIDDEYRATLPESVAKNVDEEKAGENSLMTVAPATVQVNFKSFVTRFRCKAFLADEGDATFVISAGGKVVESFELKGAGKSKDIDLRLPQTRELVLSVEINGIQHGDWGVWMNPEVR